jgi:hypothetical protein
MIYSLTKEGSLNLKNIVATLKTRIPNISNMDTLDNLINDLHEKRNKLIDELTSSHGNYSEGQKNTLKTYIDDFNDLLNLTNERANELNNPSGGRRRRKLSRKKKLSRRRKSFKKKSRRRHY